MTSQIKEPSSNLRFGGSLWCNMDIALRNIDQMYSRAAQSFGLSVIEWYVLQALYDQDGQHASELARAVGRAATSFTPNLDKLQNKGLIERQADTRDRRAVRIYLTQKAKEMRPEIEQTVNKIENKWADQFSEDDYKTFLNIVATMQTLNVD